MVLIIFYRVCILSSRSRIKIIFVISIELSIIPRVPNILAKHSWVSMIVRDNPFIGCCSICNCGASIRQENRSCYYLNTSSPFRSSARPLQSLLLLIEQ